MIRYVADNLFSLVPLFPLSREWLLLNTDALVTHTPPRHGVHSCSLLSFGLSFHRFCLQKSKEVTLECPLNCNIARSFGYFIAATVRRTERLCSRLVRHSLCIDALHVCLFTKRRHSRTEGSIVDGWKGFTTQKRPSRRKKILQYARVVEESSFQFCSFSLLSRLYPIGCPLQMDSSPKTHDKQSCDSAPGLLWSRRREKAPSERSVYLNPLWGKWRRKNVVEGTARP